MDQVLADIVFCADRLLLIVRLSGLCEFFFLMIRRPPRSTLDRSSAASDVYKRQVLGQGPVPLDVLERQMDDWILSEKARA